MRWRWPRTLWRYTSLEFWRLMLLSTAVLVTVASFATTVKPLADGRLGAVEALRFMFLAMLPMLQYVLPFAAGFAATLAYHRLAQDNELTAAHAGGVGHRSLLAPALGAGVLLAAALVWVADQAIPRFLRSMEELISQDVARVMITSIGRDQTLEFDGKMVHAEGVQRLGPDPAIGATERLLLSRLAIVDTDDEGRVVGELTAARAWVWLFPVGRDGRVRGAAGGAGEGEGSRRGGMTMVFMRLEQAGGEGGLLVAGGERTDHAFVVPGAFDDDPKYLTFSELRALRRQPERMNWIESRRVDFAHHLGARMLTESVRDALAQRREVRMTDAQGRAVTLRGAGIEWEDDAWRVAPPLPGGRVEVEIAPAQPGGEPERLSAGSASLVIDIGPDRTRRALSVALRLSDVLARAGGPGGATRSERLLTGLEFAENPVRDLVEHASSAELLELARQRTQGPEPDEHVARPARELRDRIERLQREITSKQHERVASGAACLVMTLTGALMAMRLRQALPLVVYLWSFFPAIVSILTIAAGQELTEQTGWPGLEVLWGGVLGLGGYALGVYRVVRRR